jgi:hypothetical protein
MNMHTAYQRLGAIPAATAGTTSRVHTEAIVRAFIQRPLGHQAQVITVAQRMSLMRGQGTTTQGTRLTVLLQANSCPAARVNHIFNQARAVAIAQRMTLRKSGVPDQATLKAPSEPQGTRWDHVRWRHARTMFRLAIPIPIDTFPAAGAINSLCHHHHH